MPKSRVRKKKPVRDQWSNMRDYFATHPESVWNLPVMDDAAHDYLTGRGWDAARDDGVEDWWSWRIEPDPDSPAYQIVDIIPHGDDPRGAYYVSLPTIDPDNDLGVWYPDLPSLSTAIEAIEAYKRGDDPDTLTVQAPHPK